MSELPPRPTPPVPLSQRAGEWLRWVGPWRVLGTVVVLPLVGLAAWWLVRPPAPTTESRLPYTSAAVSATTVAGTATTAESAAATGDDTIVVHVAGAVTAPGVYALPHGSRVIDAVTVAGGTVDDADTDAINLAAVVSDGQRVYVPLIGEVVPASAAGEVGVQPAGPVDINRATVEALETLPGVGPATAAAIVAHRDEQGPFASVDALADVSGIGPAKLAAIRNLVTV